MPEVATAIPEITYQPAVVSDERPWPPPQGQWTYDDWLRLPDDGWRYEIIQGELYMGPAPSTQHQRVSHHLELELGIFVRDHGLGDVFSAPTDVYLPGQETPVQPDLLFVATERGNIIAERGVEGAPDLVVEIFSPRTWLQDRRVKLPLYEETGVQECWLIDPATHTVEVYILQDKTYALMGQWGRGETVRSTVVDGFAIPVDMLFPRSGNQETRD
ncbi:MAG: Uma2 family endonuclease [Chloroflexi bacterium]|nr:Uma2 family endonuclease [Chloroflexota bacterium]MBU1661304.1 Uma2 family endonuclease [Chloroflexota bacterium]